MKNNILLLIFFSCPLLMSAQLYNVEQKTKLKEMSIRKIEITEVSMDTNGIVVNEQLKNKICVNKDGYIVRDSSFDKNGKLKTLDVFEYDDSLLLERNTYTYDSIKITSYSWQYSYNKKNQIDKHYIYRGLRLGAKAYYIYSKNALLKREKQVLYGDKKMRSQSGTIISEYTYNANKQIETEKNKSNFGKGNKKFIYQYEYDTRGNLIARYVQTSNKKTRFLQEKRVFDNNNHLSSYENFNETRMILHRANTVLDIKPGNSIKTQRVYDNDGLIAEEKISANDQLRIIVKYKYIK